MLQEPPAQLPTAFGGAHGSPQPPQLVVVSSRVSQPLPLAPSQLP